MRVIIADSDSFHEGTLRELLPLPRKPDCLMPES